MLSIYCLA